jgi:two-component system sensor histidine kinase KdpD
MDESEAGVRIRQLLRRPSAEAIAVGSASLIAATLAAAAVEAWLGVDDASAIYLMAVVLMAGRYGTREGIATSIASFLAYDFLLIEPRYTFTVQDPQEWLSLLLFLIVATVTGRLAALQAERAQEASRRAREAQSLFGISRSLATATSVREAAVEIVERLRADTDVQRVWIGVGTTPAQERAIADTAPEATRPDVAIPWILRRQPGDRAAEWVRIHAGRRDRAREAMPAGDVDVFRVPIVAHSEQLGSVWAVSPRSSERPRPASTRILSLAADQLALALYRERLSREATEAEIARQSDALKSALLDSVSHDLRTPLSSIRASAGSLLDPAVDWSPEERRSLARAIDVEAERLSRVVRNLLDLSRIQAGAIVPDLEVYELRELVEPVVKRLAVAVDGRAVTIDIADDLPVLIDAVFFDEVLTNLLENAMRYAPSPAPIRIAAREADPEHVTLVVEDGGPGVPAEALSRVFDKFFRVDRPREGSRRGLGIGLSVVRGLVDAMGGQAEAARSDLGGLAIHLTLRVAPAPVTEGVG